MWRVCKQKKVMLTVQNNGISYLEHKGRFIYVNFMNRILQQAALTASARLFSHLSLSLLCMFFISYVVVMPKKRQALVEYEDMNGSSTAVTYAADNQVYIAGHPAFINYSTSQKISRPGDSDDSRSVNNVLLLTIMNPIYPITTVNAKTWVKVKVVYHLNYKNMEHKIERLDEIK